MKEKSRPSLVETRVDTKIIIMSAWITLMCLFIYCDIFTIFRPGTISGITSGKMGPMDVSQASLFLASFLMVIPSLMIFVTPLMAARASRAINLVVCALFLFVNIGNLIGETWGYYYLFGLLEEGITILIFVIALRWPKQT